MVNKFFGKKIGMSQYFIEEGECVPVTLVQTNPCVVVQKKTQDKDGYNAVQVGFGEQKASRLSKAEQGHLKAAGDKCFSCLREIRVDDPDLSQRLVDAEIEFEGEASTNSLLPILLGWVVPMLPLLLI